MARIDGAEVAKHSGKNDCWIVLDSKAYDVTNFLSEHPGGAPIILKNAGSVSASGTVESTKIDVQTGCDRRV
jgi:cytochrome b involved in lipid metabolism